MKPSIYILKYGSIEKLKNPILQDALGLHVTTGLVVYESGGKKKGMIIDPGMVCDFVEHTVKLKEFGLKLSDITHILCTHMHQDHIQALAKYPDGVIVVHYGSASVLGRPDYHGKNYSDGTIEIPEISYKLISNAHTKKDTIYIIDSDNEGEVAFMGDIVFSMYDVIDKDSQKSLDKNASVDPDKRLTEGQNFFADNHDIEGFYLGHCNRKVGRGEMGEYFESYNQS